MEVKALYAEAAGLWERAKGIMDEYKGKEMPGDKAAEVDRLLDEVDAKTAQAKRAERAQDTERLLSEVKRPAMFGEANDAKRDEPETEYKSAFNAYLKKGVNGLTGAEVKALSAGDAAAGGYLVTDTFVRELIAKTRSVSAMRRIARTLPPIPGGSAIAPTEENALSDATWTSEVLTGSADTIKPFGQRMLTPHPLAKRIKVSNTLLRGAAFDVEAWVRDAMAYKFGVPEEYAFINGTGAQQPLGILNSGITAYTTATSVKVYGDDIINWVYSLPAAYAGNATILCNRAFIRKVRALHTFAASAEADQYLWQPGLSVGAPNTILGVPYEESDQVNDGLDSNDAWETTAQVAVIGDFRFYWIVDALGMSIQRLNELYAETNEVGFIGRKETDGMCVNTDAFRVLKVQ